MAEISANHLYDLGFVSIVYNKRIPKFNNKKITLQLKEQTSWTSTLPKWYMEENLDAQSH